MSARGISPPSPSCCIASVTDRYLILLPSFPSSSFSLCLSVFFYVQLAVMQAHGVHCQFSRPDCLQPTLGLILSFQLPFPHTAAPNVSFLKKKTVLPPQTSIASNNKFHILTHRCRECNRDLLSCFTSVRLLTFASSCSLPYHEHM